MARRLSVEPVAFTFFVVIYLEYISIQDVLYNKLCIEIINTTDHICNRSEISTDQSIEISKHLSFYTSIYMGILNFCTLIACLFTGSWSDSFGRRPLMALPSALGLFAEVIFIICSLNSTSSLLVPLVMLAAVFNGITGGSATVLASCFGYIADITPIEERTRGLSLLEAAFIIGGFVGSYLTTFILKSAHLSLDSRHMIAFSCCIVLHLIILLYVYCIPETDRPLRPPDQSHLKSMLNTISERRPSRLTIFLLCILGISNSCSMSATLTLSLPWLKQAVAWDSSQYSLYNGTHLLLCGISLILLLPLLRWSMPTLITDSIYGFLGFASKALGLINFAFASTTLQVYLGLALFLFADFSMPAIRSLMSQAVTQHERGKAFAFLAAVQTVASFAFSFLLPAIFRNSPPSLPGLTFLLVAILQLLAALLMLFLTPPSSLSSSSPSNVSS